MSRNYHQLLPYAFKRFSVERAFVTGPATLHYYLTRKALPKSDKPALFTMNILPPMMTVWYHFVTKYLGDRVDTVIFDCSGKLNKKEFPDARVHKFLNLYAATKSEEFIRNIAKHRKITWICDDDMFFVDEKAVDIVEKEMAAPDTASVSFRPRTWWEFDIGGKRYPPSSSYCNAINRDIFVKENLSLAPADNNPHPSLIGKSRRYDTFDKANEILIQKGYRCYILPKEQREKYVTGFSGMSGAVILLWHFKRPEQVIDYFLTPPKEKWRGSVLFGVLAAMLAISTIQDLYELLQGHRYPLPALPSRSELEKIRESHTQYLRNDQSFDWVDEASAKLRAAL